MKVTKMELFLEIALPNENGFSRWVDVKEFVNKYKKFTTWKWWKLVSY